ncbi:MAG: hypothetical protein R3E42_03090 [Burkholderiaceae bacterium]
MTWGPDFAKMTQGSQITQRRSLAELSADMGGTEVPVAALFAWLKGEPALVTGWQADLSRHAEGRVTAKRTTPAHRRVAPGFRAMTASRSKPVQSLHGCLRPPSSTCSSISPDVATTDTTCCNRCSCSSIGAMS